MTQLYYTPPADEHFEEVRKMSILLWKEIDTDNDEFGYATSKINRVKDIRNVGDNFMYMVAMFDINNQRKLAEKLSPETRKAIKDRMLDGGSFENSIVF